MTDSMQTRAGREGKKGDLSVRLARRDAGGVGISVQSSAGQMFGRQIGERAAQTLAGPGVKGRLIEIGDTGAFDYGIMASIEAAARRLGTLIDAVRQHRPRK